MSNKSTVFSTIASIVAVALAIASISVSMSVNSNLKTFSEQVKTAFAEVGQAFAGVNNENEEFVGGLRVGTSSPAQFAVDTQGRMTYREQHTALTGTTTLLASESGKTIYLSGPTSTITLPAVSTGLTFRFVVNASVTGVIKVSSVAGDDISGILQVNAADVTCLDNDIVNIIDTAETLGDFFELRSDGARWWIGDSAGDLAGSLTCTG